MAEATAQPATSDKPETASPSGSAKQQTTFGLRLGYSTGVLSYACKDVAFGSFVLFYYVSVVGLSGTLAGLAIFISLIWDAITDPVVGSLSDNWRSRWGRRHPLMALGGLPLGLSLLALFWVPAGLGQLSLFAWMLVTCLAVRTFFTLFTVPYLALGAELSTDYHERSLIAGLRTVLGWISAIVLTAFAWLVLFSSDGELDARLNPSNYLEFGLLCLVLVGVFTTIAIMTTAKRIPALPQGQAVPQRFSLRSVVRDMTVALRNHNFRTLFLLLLTAGIATGLNAALGTHMATYFWELSTTQLSLQALGGLVPVVLMWLLMPALNRRIEKQRVLEWTVLALVLNSLWFVPGRLFGWIPENGHPVVFPLVLLHAYISIALIVWFQTITGSVIADISDEQEHETQQRQEGMFFAAQGFSIKFVTGIGTFLGGIVIDVIGLEAGAAPGTVPEPVLFQLGIVMGPIIALTLVVPFLFARRLKLSQAKHAQIRSALEQTRSESS